MAGMRACRVHIKRHRLPGNRLTRKAVEVLRTRIRSLIARQRAADREANDFLSLL